jgi:hypothetical protein
MSKNRYTRKYFLASGITVGALLPANSMLSSIPLHVMQSVPEDHPVSGTSTLLEVDFRELVSRADLDYTEPVKRSQAGQPVGNGRMGRLVWTEPTSLKFQFNRVDVSAANCATNSFPERHTDSAAAVAMSNIDFCDFGSDVLGGSGLNQHLSVYDGIVTVQGSGRERCKLLHCAAASVATNEPQQFQKILSRTYRYRDMRNAIH